MKILIFSDIHGDRRALERLMATEADLYIAAGDLSSWRRGLEGMGAVLAARADRVWVLPGNHESEADVARLCGEFGLRNFHGQSEVVDGVGIAGLGYSNPTPFDTPGEYTEAQLAEKLAVFVEAKPRVVVCHCPPKGTPLDQIKPGLHAGSSAVASFIEQLQPEWFFCGHIHEAEGVETRLGATRAVNVGKRGYLLDTGSSAEA